MKVSYLALCFVAASLVLTSCSEETPEYLNVDYSGWARTTQEGLTDVVPGHGTGLRRIYINGIGTDVITTEDGTMRYPAGTVILKEAFPSESPAPDSRPPMIVGMVKAPDSDFARGGWIWVVRNTTLGSEEIFAEEYCITCHANANKSHPYGDRNSEQAFRDYVYYPYVDE